jgi:hypothetical protein
LTVLNLSALRLALQQEITRSEDWRYDHRLHGILLISQGLSCYQVADWMGENPRMIERWVHRFESRASRGCKKESARVGMLSSASSPRRRLAAIQRSYWLLLDQLEMAMQM